MKFLLAIVTIFSLFTFVYSYCPNGCNGQGTCGANDKCTCYTRADDPSLPAYTGPDCSRMTCPSGDAWIELGADSASLGNSYVRGNVLCSNMGVCDTGSGECQCFDGFEGRACERTNCPNNCNGKGICKTEAQLHIDGVAGTYSAWDASKIMGCVCDKGYRGADCSIKECPSGSDVLLGDGSSKGRDCGGRGKCNRETGTCECFPGYYDTTCSSQTTVQ